jgi:hypothetical protein
MSRIEPHPGLDVFVNQNGGITIAQITECPHPDDPIVAVHPDDVPRLIRMLKAAAVELRTNDRPERPKRAAPPALPPINAPGVLES